MAKNKKKNKKVTFNTVLNHYKNNDFSKAKHLLPKAKLTAQEKGLAKQLKAYIDIKLAFYHFSKFEYKTALALSVGNRNIKLEVDYPINFDVADLIAGISNLYLGNFEEAKKWLFNTGLKPELMQFSFYYILSCLYAGDYVDIKSIKGFNKKINPITITENKKRFLRAVFYLQKDNIDSFKKTINKIVPAGNLEVVNLEALKSWLSNKSNLPVYKKTKPLYKLLNKLQLTPEELEFLNTLDGLEDFLSLNNVNEIEENINFQINELCEKGKPINQKYFYEYVDLETLDLYKKERIIYNQFVALLTNNKHFEKNDSTLKKILKKYDKLFFNVPESIFAFLKFVSETNVFSTSVFIRFLNLYLKQNINKLTEIQIQNIGFMLADVFYTNKNILKSSKKIIADLKPKYNFLGLDCFTFCFEITNGNSSKYAFKRMVEHELYYKYSYDVNKTIGDLLEQAKNKLSSQNRMSNFNFMSGLFGFNNYDDDEGDDEDYKEYADTYILPLINAISGEYTAHRKSKDLLSIYQIIGDSVDDSRILNAVPAELIDNFLDSYSNKIEVYKQNRPNNKYNEAFLDVSSTIEFERIEAIIIYSSDKEFLNTVKKYDNDSKLGTFIEIIKKYIDLYSIEKKMFHKFVKLAEYIYNNSTKKLLDEYIGIFSESKNDLLLFVKYFLNNFTKRYNINNNAQLAVYIVENNFVELKEDNTFELERGYNIVINAFNIIKKEEKTKKTIKYSEVFIDDGISVLRRSLLKNKIKKIETAYNSSIKYFKRDKEIDVVKIVSLIRNKEYEKLEDIYFHEFINKNKAEIFQDFIIEFAYSERGKKNTYKHKNYNHKIVFILLKVYLDRLPETPDDTLFKILKKYIQNSDNESIEQKISIVSNGFQISYANYEQFYYSCKELYIKTIGIRINISLIKRSEILYFIDFIINSKVKIKYDNVLVNKCLQYLGTFANKRNSAKDLKKIYNRATIFFGFKLSKVKTKKVF